MLLRENEKSKKINKITFLGSVLTIVSTFLMLRAVILFLVFFVGFIGRMLINNLEGTLIGNIFFTSLLGHTDMIGYSFNGSPILKILFMLSWSAQVGGAIALFVKAKKGSRVRKHVVWSLIPWILQGYSSALVYAVMISRIKPFFTAMLGAAVGGIYIWILSNLGYALSFNTGYFYSPINILGIQNLSGTHVELLLCILGMIITSLTSFLLTYFYGTKDVNLS